MADEKRITEADLYEAETAFNVASLLGKSIQAAGYMITHPDYQPIVYTWNGQELPPDDFGDDDEDEEEEESPGLPDPAGGASDIGLPVIHSREASIDSQIKQIEALYLPELHDFLAESALYDMFRLASEQFRFDLKTDDPSVELSHSDKKKAALAWIIVKRVFAVRHPNETWLIISATEEPIKNAQKISFRPIDDIDRQFIVETCSLLAESFEEEEEPPVSSAPTIAQIPPQDDRFIALANKAFREQRTIAARNRITPIDVGNAIIQARIGKDGEPPVELTEFEMLIEQAIGEIIYYQTRLYGDKCLPIAMSPEQLYRWAVYDRANGSTVTKSQRDMTIKAFDKLIQTPAELHILEQLEKHTRLKSKPGYKQLLKNEGVIVGTLVTGVRLGFYRYNDKIINDALVVSFMPMFFYYSSFTGQLLKVDRQLLTGEAIKATPERNTPYDAVLKTRILCRVNLIKQEFKGKNKKLVQSAKYGNKTKPMKSFTKVILFSSLAEECGLSLDSPKKLEVFRNKVWAYMQELERQGTIAKAEQKYESRKMTGISVTVC